VLLPDRRIDLLKLQELSGSNKVDLSKVILSVGEPLGGPWKLKSGTYYEVEITADGSGEIGLDISSFSRAVWIDEIVIEGLEIRGKYTIRIPGSTGESQKLEVEIE